ELGKHVAQRGLRRVPPGAVLAREARAPRRGRLLPGRVSPVSPDRPAEEYGPRGPRLEQRVSQGRPRAPHAAALPGARAVLGVAAGVPHAARAGQCDLRRSAPSRARRDGRESRLVLEPVDLRRGAPPLRRDGGVRHGGSEADPHGETDATGHRRWAIDQRAHRPGAAAAVAALAEAATAADYFRTRAAAVEALGELPAASAAAPLAAALRDTSAQVRRAAVAALGQLGGARAADLARTTFHDDPSYEVRAAALTAFVRADSTASDSAIAWGLATPSYQDVVQEAAYRLIAQTGDTGAIPRVESLLATDHFAAHVLAALAARGSAHA